MRKFTASLFVLVALFSFLSISTGCSDDPVSAGATDTLVLASDTLFVKDTLYIDGGNQFVIPVTANGTNTTFVEFSMGDFTVYEGTTTLTWPEPSTNDDWFRMVSVNNIMVTLEDVVFSPTSVSIGFSATNIHPHSGNLKFSVVLFGPSS